MTVAKPSDKCIKNTLHGECGDFCLEVSLAKPPNPVSSGGSSMFLVNGFHWPLISSLWGAFDHNKNTGNRDGCHHITQGVKFCCVCRVKESSLLFPLAIHHEVYETCLYCQRSSEL